MSFTTVLCRAQVGLQAPLVRIEAHLTGGLSQFAIVGLAETAVKESRGRVRAAILNAGFSFPQGRVTVNLAPADIPKEGGRFDLPIALGILAAARQLPVPPEVWERHEFYGELALSGSLRHFRGALPVTLAARADRRVLVVPRENRDEVTVVNDIEVATARHICEIVSHLSGAVTLELERVRATPGKGHRYPDLADVRGQYHARRALEIAAAGGHSLLLVGPPGTGKSMLAARLSGILPEISEEEALETAAIQSLSSAGFSREDWRIRPFRAPHHTASAAALVGGGSNPRPGEISLAHNGVLFLDELPEFRRQVLEVLRQPLESGHIVISRAARQAQFPCRFQLIAAMNPCPCGYRGDPDVTCYCGEAQIQRYRQRISGPLLDRIDLQIEVPRVERALLRPDAPPGEGTRVVRDRVLTARRVQARRGVRCNARLDESQVARHCMPDGDGEKLLDRAMERLALSARAYKRILRVARTIADLDNEQTIKSTHIGEAIGYRLLDRESTASARGGAIDCG